MTMITITDRYTLGVWDGLHRHTWMRDGVTYVGNGQYTLKEALRLAEEDLDITFTPTAEENNER